MNRIAKAIALVALCGSNSASHLTPFTSVAGCAPFLGMTGKKCLGFGWENGTLTPLPTLGGPNGYATSVNNRGQVVGWAENLVEDPTCNAPQLYQFRAVLWEPKKGATRELPP